MKAELVGAGVVIFCGKVLLLLPHTPVFGVGGAPLSENAFGYVWGVRF